jgi:hypothetical protein
MRSINQQRSKVDNQVNFQITQILVLSSCLSCLRVESTRGSFVVIASFWLETADQLLTKQKVLTWVDPFESLAF